MSRFRTPKQRLPDHLKHLSRGSAGQGRPAGAAPTRTARKAESEPSTEPAPDRLGELLPVVLHAMMAGKEAGNRPVIVSQADVLAALAPYHRPRSRFEGLMVRRLVGEGYLRPRGARDKHGLSDAYELTPRGEELLGWRRPR